MRPNFASNRGSALLIVLGLLAFLMISAVAFSISMRTEHSAAAAYRRNLLARELLSTAFADARATLDYALEGQRDDAGFNRDSASTRTVEALAPFKYPGEDRYGRLITSRNSDAFDATSVGDDPIAYLLDGKVLAHVPPYVVYPVYMALEQQQPAVNEGADHLGDGNRYYIDWSAGWKPIKTKIPKLTVDVATAGNTIQEAVVGRMAWAVVNLSDSLDINAIGSASTCRGLGLTASEFAFGITDTAKVKEAYALLKENRGTVSGTELGLHTFCSNADLAQYAANATGDDLIIESDGIAPFSWQDAIATGDDGFYSPFSVYSFWPKSDRKKEDGTRASSDSDETTLSCNDIDEGAVANAASGTGKELADAVNKALGATGTEGDNFISLLHDYLDKDSEPEFVSEAGDQWANAQPTVERVPMLTEVAYDAEGWARDGALVNDIKKAFEDAFKGLGPKVSAATITNVNDIPSHFGDQTVDIELPKFSQRIGLRSYFPGGKASTESFSFKPEGFAGVIAAATKGSTSIPLEKGVAKVNVSVNSNLDVEGGSEILFRSTGVVPSLQLSFDEKFTLKFKGDKLPVANLDKPSPDTAEAMEVDLLVDFFFRVPCKRGTAVVDLCPADMAGSELSKADYPATLNERMSLSTMSKLDAQFFRVTRPVKVTFTLQWKVTEETQEKQTVYKASIDDQALKVDVEIEMGSTLKMGEGKEFVAAGEDKASYQSLSPDVGTWFAIDPRYNWLSPMFGVSDDPSAYTGTNGGNYRKNFSSPHWIFQGGSGELTSGDNNPSPIQQDYAEAHKSLVPFTWGLAVEDIRYGYNDAGQLLLPAELAFLPVPYDSNVWSTSKRYLSNSLANYHERVAKASFFRTLPVVDLKDGAMDYTKYTKLASLLRGFGGENFPEEHRGIVNAFAAQDNYLLHQRLKQFALLGIPPTIKQAAYVTYQRLKSAESVKRVASGMVNEDLKALKDLTPDAPLTSEDAKPKYDEFVTKYLFPLPTTSGGNLERAMDWTRSNQTLYEGKTGTPTRPKTLDFIVQDDPNGSFAERLMAYNATKGSSDKLGQNDMTTLLAIAKESFGDRQQLFLFILRADFIAYNSARELSAHKPLSTARAVALVWRDAYGELPDRVVYYQFIP